jgi:2-iminobutanoate/2-iminopropanoate deaminase
MALIRITSGPGVPMAVAAYSAATVAGNICFLAGQLALDENGNMRHGTAAEETRWVLENLEASARAAGFVLDDFAFVHVLLEDIRDFDAVDNVYAKFFEGRELPARMMYEAGAFNLQAKVEITAIVVRDEG